MSSPMSYGSSSAAGDVGVARTGSGITLAMQPSAAHGETSGPRPGDSAEPDPAGFCFHAGGVCEPRASEQTIRPAALDVMLAARLARG